ncbi:MAG: SprT family zinc-dependent metalloprotease [Leptospira sp.]|jgi:predicted metal-dependent hydrolase|nr:SprT family zinc-dependent metalloprotease [Leptospira sp.]
MVNSKISYPGLGYLCELRQIRSKNVSLTVYPNNRIVLRYPRHVSKKFIHDFLIERSEWVKNQYEKNDSQNPKKTSFEDGEVLPLFGSKKKVVHTKTNQSQCTDTELILNVKSIRSENGRIKLAKKILRDELERRSLPKLRKYLQKVGTSNYNTNFKLMRSLWGSCTHENKITLNLALVFCPEFVLNYVILHEVAHTKERNHSSKFWNQVESLDPDYKEAEKWIKIHGKRMLCYLY